VEELIKCRHEIAVQLGDIVSQLQEAVNKLDDLSLILAGVKIE
jgi:hypothetical protein